MRHLEGALAPIEAEAERFDRNASVLREAAAILRTSPGRPTRARTFAALKLADPRRVSLAKRTMKRTPRAPKGQGVGASSARILTEWGRPCRVNDLLVELGKRGVKVGGKRPYATLAATLLKHKGIKRAGRGLFAAATS